MTSETPPKEGKYDWLNAYMGWARNVAVEYRNAPKEEWWDLNEDYFYEIATYFWGVMGQNTEEARVLVEQLRNLIHDEELTFVQKAAKLGISEMEYEGIEPEERERWHRKFFRIIWKRALEEPWPLVDDPDDVEDEYAGLD